MTDDQRWWEGGTIYHVYVRSFQDTDGDGFGDLEGVINRLDHLAWLGIDGLWLSPTMPSPNDDWGYDVADYRDVHPDYGDLATLDNLVAEAGQRGIRVLLDLVPNHTSAAHPWFVDARSSATAEHRDWYVWADPGSDGGPPNNWLDSTGGPAWTFDGATGQYYLHNFLPSQPDLNWWNPAVHRALVEVLDFWFERGVAGFRIDVAHALYKDRELRDDPVVARSPSSPFGRDPVHSMNRPESHEVFRAWRRRAEGHPPERVLLGETWVFDPVRLAAFYGRDDELQLCFNFPFVFAPLEAPAMSAVVRRTLDALPERACPVWVGSNHDVSRMATRWAGDDPARTRLALTLLATLPGALVLYYGDELGLPDVVVPPDEQRDPMTWRADDGRFNRDRARTPMPWDGAVNAGFCPSGARPWLPVGDRAGRDVASQRADPESVLWLTRRLLEVRRTHLGSGVPDYEEIGAPEGCWSYRCGPLRVDANLSAAAATGPSSPVLLRSQPGDAPGRLRPWEAVISLA